MDKLTSNELDFLARPLHGVLSTQETRGRIHSVPVNYLVEVTNESSRVFVLTSGSSKKARNVVEMSSGSLCVFDGPLYVTVAGTLTISADSELRHWAELAYQRKYSKVPRDNSRRVIIAMEIERVVSRGLSS